MEWVVGLWSSPPATTNPSGEHWPSLQCPFCSFFLPNRPQFCWTSPMHAERKVASFLVRNKVWLVWSIVVISSPLPVIRYMRGHVTQFCPMKDEERCSRSSCFSSGWFHGWMKQMELQLPPCTSLRTTREEVAEQLSCQDLCLMSLHC